MRDKEKSYKIKIPIFTTEIVGDSDGIFGRMTYSDMIEDLKSKINSIQSESSFDNRNKTKKTVINKVNFTEHTIFGVSFIVFAIFLFVLSMKIQTKNETYVREGEQGGWIAAGYIFCVLGGLIGLVIGCKYVFSKRETVSGEEFYKYNESTRKHGKRMLILFAIMSVLFVIMTMIG